MFFLTLELVVVETDDLCTSESCNVSQWSTDTAADIQYGITLLDTNLRGEVILVTSNRSLERLTLVLGGEVERLTPT